MRKHLLDWIQPVLRTLNPVEVQPSSPTLLTRGGPLRTSIKWSLSIRLLSHYEFDTGSTSNRHRNPESISVSGLILQFELSWGKLRVEPATRRFDKSFAPTPQLSERFARQYRNGPPLMIRLASSYHGVDHLLSGLILPTRRLCKIDTSVLPHCLAGNINSSVRVSRRALRTDYLWRDGLLQSVYKRIIFKIRPSRDVQFPHGTCILSLCWNY